MEWLEMGIAYGPLGVLTVIVILIVIWHYKTEKRVDIVENKVKEHSDIHKKHSEYHSKAFEKLENLEKKEIASDGRFDNIDTSLERIETGLAKVVDHFVAQGMKK